MLMRTNEMQRGRIQEGSIEKMEKWDKRFKYGTLRKYEKQKF